MAGSHASSVSARIPSLTSCNDTELTLRVSFRPQPEPTPTSPFSPRDAPYASQATETLLVATQDSRDIIAAAQRALARIWRDNYRYAKAGIMLADFSGREAQLNLFDECAPRPDSEALMNAVDRINRGGKGRMFFAGQGIDVGFAMRREMLSPEYTTDWNALPRAFMR
ncbi:DUF4113 domain-containing protein (plasmid) [Klebsiella pneumoniae]|nr:DUF4113 domain-containing protein [Klebsiella pneumoniae]